MSEIKRTYIVKEAPKQEELPAISIDDSIKSILICVKRIVDKITENTSRGAIPDRNTVMTLKDCLAMLFEAKKKEDEIMSEMSESQLEQLINSKKQ